MAPAQVTMNNLNSERIKNEKKTLLSLKLGTSSGSHASERCSQQNMIRGGGELFQIVNRDGTQRYPTYKIKHYAGESIDGTFYEEELQVTPNEYYKFKKSLKSHKIKGCPKRSW